MLSHNTRVVAHFGKFVPCCEGRVIAHADSPARLVRATTREEAELISNNYKTALYSNTSQPKGFQAGDVYMLSQHPQTVP